MYYQDTRNEFLVPKIPWNDFAQSFNFLAPNLWGIV